MYEDETTINPKPIVSFMFAVSVGFWAKQVAEYKFDRTPESWLVLVSGILFLVDLLCIVWWYAKYIYRIRPSVSFGIYFLDFVICSMFALAANSWTKPDTFLFATLLASVFLMGRFVNLYLCSDASMTDKGILSKAGFVLLFASASAFVCLVMADKVMDIIPAKYNLQDIDILKNGVPGALSLIGVILTLTLWRKIDVAVAIYLARHTPISPSHLKWPVSKSPDVHQRERIRQQVTTGLEDFDKLFCQYRKHDRVHSHVHSDTELRVQSYILSLPSCQLQDYADEIRKKAFMVGVSHWLDDLVDGRSEVHVYKQLKKYKKLQYSTALSDDIGKAENLFRQIYRPLIIKHTDRNFYDQLHRLIANSCSLPFNRKYMFLGLNRIAYGAVIFSPKLTPEHRRDILDNHNNFLKNWNDETKGKFEQEVEDLIDIIAVGDKAGPILLGLTTKTVQEIAFSSEGHEMNVSLSILFSILYAPLIYYHNIFEELHNNEMVPLQAFDTDSDLWICWLKQARKIINRFNNDQRAEMRLRQIEMAYVCFKPMLPKTITTELDEIYLQEPEDVSPVQKTN